MASVQQQEGYFRDLVERLVHQFEGRAHYDDEMEIIREAREALMKTENVSTSVGHGDGVTVGNVAKIRKALIAAKGIFDSIGVNALAGELNLDAVAMTCASMSAKIDAAINTPARNCDRFSSGEEAWIAFERERPNWCDEHSSKDPDCTDCEMADCGRCMAEWLLGPEGGAE